MVENKGKSAENALVRLVSHLTKSSESLDRNIQVCLKIFNLSDPHWVEDEVEEIEILIERLRLAVVRHPAHDEGERVLRFINLVRRLQTRPIVKHPWAALRLLELISPLTSVGSTKTKGEKQLHLISPWKDTSVKGSVGLQADHGRSALELDIIRDMPYVLQGVSSRNMVFISDDSVTYPEGLEPSVMLLLHKAVEPGLLYRQISLSVGEKKIMESVVQGLTGQSLKAAISHELRSYLNLLSALENEIRLDIERVTFRRCLVWFTDATDGLRLLAHILHHVQNTRGGKTISKIYELLGHGDSYVVEFTNNLLSAVTEPFYGMLDGWICKGTIVDPYVEFFVQISEKPGPSVWHDTYLLEKDMIPYFIGSDLATQIFLTGKSLNFIRYACDERDWVESYAREHRITLRYGDTVALEEQITCAYKETTARLTNIMLNKFQLILHLKAYKKYILLGQGDFIGLLIRLLSEILHLPADSLFRHDLTAILESAIQGSSAQYEHIDVLRRLDARMLELSHGEVGWDVFTLEYKVDSPLDEIVTPACAREYLKLFNFLWRIKRLESLCVNLWRKTATGSRGPIKESKLDWHRARIRISSMIHLLVQLQYYILFEVIESSWDQLMAAINKPDCTLDTLINAHKLYITSITHKGLLGARGESLLPQLHEMLKIILRFQQAMEAMYNCAFESWKRKQILMEQQNARTAKGDWGILEDEDIHDQCNREGIEQNKILDVCAKEFDIAVSVLITDLAYQQDTEMRFLGIRLNFNEHYALLGRRRAGK